MKIIGKATKNKVFKTRVFKCLHCATVAEYEKKDVIKVTYDDLPIPCVICPGCKREIIVNSPDWVCK